VADALESELSSTGVLEEDVWHRSRREPGRKWRPIYDIEVDDSIPSWPTGRVGCRTAVRFQIAEFDINDGARALAREGSV